MRLWPRMALPVAERLLLCGERALVRDPVMVEKYSWRDVPLGTAATGGTPITIEELTSLREELSTVARHFGYPEAQKPKTLTAFDAECARTLSRIDMTAGEGLRSETWAWISSALVPHVVLWRWPFDGDRLTVERFAGHLVRNQFGRIWYAQHALVQKNDDGGEWKAHDSLGSDQLVGLFERPALGSSPVVARAISKAWSSLQRQQGDRIRFREAMKLLIVRAAIQRLDLVDYDELVRIVQESFNSVVVTASYRSGGAAFTAETQDE